MGVGRRQEFENFSKKGVFFISSGTKKILPLFPPGKTFGKIH